VVRRMASHNFRGVPMTKSKSKPKAPHSTSRKTSRPKPRARSEHILCAGRLGELPACREMVGMNMGVDDKKDAHAGSVCGAQIRLDLTDGIDDGAGRTSTTAEQV
jgi:hypothetical protein